MQIPEHIIPQTFINSCSKDEFKLLKESLKAADSPNIQYTTLGSHKSTPLCMAALEGWHDLVVWLIKNKADPNLSSDGFLPLYSAYQLENWSIVKYLLQHGARNQAQSKSDEYMEELIHNNKFERLYLTRT